MHLYKVFVNMGKCNLLAYLYPGCCYAICISFYFLLMVIGKFLSCSEDVSL